ncbi:mechanosensitive ion channel domain-containing protein [Sulfurimonas sp.]|uniref:mechanosensitive ion channel family protein n=1 Tax=Sulfurimonas sp. TaxID=2022749 RepID=UPI003D10809A
MKKLFFILTTFILVSSSFAYTKFIDAQLQNYYKLNDVNISEDEIKQTIENEAKLYHVALQNLLSDKTKFIKGYEKYEKEMFSLEKVITINERVGNSTAVLRDEVKLKSYQILNLQGKMIKDIVLALDQSSFEAYETKLAQYINQNQEDVTKINNTNYKEYLSWEPNSKVVTQLQENIKEYYAILELNKDLIVYLFRFKDKMYRLNKYANLHLSQIAFEIDSFEVIRSINSALEEYGVDIIKLLMMIFISVFVYILRKITLIFLQKILYKIPFLRAYAEKIIIKLVRPIDTLFVVININLLIYLYNNFSSVEFVARSFNIVYGLYGSYIFYIIVNTVAAIKLSSLDTSSTNVRKDVINVSIKIVNFIILIIGLLLALYFAGVDLTAVLSGLGIGGFALAFAAKDTISNFFGTISVLFSDVFSQGDWIEIENKEGVVVEIGLRVTTLRTFDNALIAIPNGTFASKEVKNWNKRKVGRRIKMNIGVKYNSKVENIQNAVIQIREMLHNHPDIATPHTKYEYIHRDMTKLVSKEDLEGVRTTLLVYMDQFSSSSIDILVYCFSKSVEWENWLKTKEDVMQKIMKILEQNSLEFAFPSLSVYQEK